MCPTRHTWYNTITALLYGSTSVISDPCPFAENSVKTAEEVLAHLQPWTPSAKQHLMEEAARAGGRHAASSGEGGSRDKRRYGNGRGRAAAAAAEAEADVEVVDLLPVRADAGVMSALCEVSNGHGYHVRMHDIVHSALTYVQVS